MKPTRDRILRRTIRHSQCNRIFGRFWERVIQWGRTTVLQSAYENDAQEHGPPSSTRQWRGPCTTSARVPFQKPPNEIPPAAVTRFPKRSCRVLRSCIRPYLVPSGDDPGSEKKPIVNTPLPTHGSGTIAGIFYGPKNNRVENAVSGVKKVPARAHNGTTHPSFFVCLNIRRYPSAFPLRNTRTRTKTRQLIRLP